MRAVPVVDERSGEVRCVDFAAQGVRIGSGNREAANNFGSCGADRRRRQPKRLQPMRAAYRTVQSDGRGGVEGGSADGERRGGRCVD